MDLKTVKNLLNLISESEVNEVEIEEGDFKIKIKKQADSVCNCGSNPVYMSNPQGMGYQMQASSPETASAKTNQSSSEVTSSPAPDSGGKFITIRSPIVGTYYTAASPESDPFITVGDSVSTGDVLCIIEAMKIMNEIESDHSGKIVKMLVENAQPVEFDQPLFLIEPA